MKIHNQNHYQGLCIQKSESQMKNTKTSISSAKVSLLVKFWLWLMSTVEDIICLYLKVFMISYRSLNRETMKEFKEKTLKLDLLIKLKCAIQAISLMEALTQSSLETRVLLIAKDLSVLDI